MHPDQPTRRGLGSTHWLRQRSPVKQKTAMATIRAELNRAGREADRNTRKLGRKRRGGIRLGVPKSASKFYFNLKSSSIAGSRGAPSSAVSKVAYDLRLDEHESRGDLDQRFVFLPRHLPASAADPLAAALACQQRAAASKYANSRTRQMLHTTVALPAHLTTEQRHHLVQKLSAIHSEKLGARRLPVFAGAHLPHGESLNFHVHLSMPAYEVRPTPGGGFEMAERLPFLMRPPERRARGLPPTNHQDLRDLRAAVADAIADACHEAGMAFHAAERWRHGHKRLHEQVEAAAVRGDLLFVADNALRDVSHHEGPAAHRHTSQRRELAETHNADQAEIGPALLTRTLLSRVLDQAAKAGLAHPEHLRMLARDMGLAIEWVKASPKRTAPVTGLRVRMDGGPVLTGREVSCTLFDLRRRFGWTESPAYARYAPKAGPEFDTYAAAVLAAGLGVAPGQPRDLFPHAVSAALHRFEHLKTQTAEQAASSSPVERAEGEAAPAAPIEPISTPTTEAPLPVNLAALRANLDAAAPQAESELTRSEARAAALAVAQDAKAMPLDPLTPERLAALAEHAHQETVRQRAQQTPMGGAFGVKGIGARATATFIDGRRVTALPSSHPARRSGHRQ